MANNSGLKQYSWVLTKIYSFMLLFSHNTFAIDQFMKRIDASKKILEIGSGTGRDFKKLRGQYSITGSDYSDAFLKTLRKKFKGSEFLKIDALTMDTKKKYDGIYSNKVLQHLTPEQLKKSFSAQYEVLNKEGILFHAMWKGTSNNEKKEGLHDIQYEKKDIEKIKGSFTISDFIVYKELKEQDSFIMILKK